MVGALFDTNILIDHLNGIPEAREEIERFESRAISIITWMEVMVGASAELVEPIRGDREIIPEEAEIVRRIFGEFASGKSPKAIAVDLNRDGVPGPLGRAWGDTSMVASTTIGAAPATTTGRSPATRSRNGCCPV